MAETAVRATDASTSCEAGATEVRQLCWEGESLLFHNTLSSPDRPIGFIRTLEEHDRVDRCHNNVYVAECKISSQASFLGGEFCVQPPYRCYQQRRRPGCCSTKCSEGMSGKLHRFSREAMSRWAVAFPGCNGKVKQLALKGTGAARGRPPRGQAWLRGSRVSPNEAGLNLRETSPLPRNILLSLEIGPRTETGQRTTARATVRCRGRALSHPVPKDIRGHLSYPLVVRDSAERGLGCIGNRHLNSLVEAFAGNVGGCPRN